jgi:hypothetical protein
MKRWNWQIILGAVLFLLSLGVYLLHYLIFRDPHHIFIFLVEDIAFVFVEVLLVTLIIHRLLQEREKKERLEKLNMVIGAFFSEVGMKLLDILSRWDPRIEGLQKNPSASRETIGQKFARISSYLKTHDFSLESGEPDWGALKAFLLPRRDFLLRLLENPNLLEHESFTDVLWAVFHLTEELEARASLRDLPEADQRHLRGDLKRVYGRLTLQWLKYMAHLKDSYPYLFSLSLRTNPFDRNATPVVQESP